MSTMRETLTEPAIIHFATGESSLGIVLAATLFGLIGASVQFRAGKTRARAEIGHD